MSIGAAAQQTLRQYRLQAANVDARLVDALNAAIPSLPQGYAVQIQSGHRPGDPRFHGRGMAADVAIHDPQGRKLENYQDAGNFQVYEKFARAARAANPDLPLRWGGYFSGGPGKYGALDLMHFDTAGDRVPMGGGSWESGLSPEQARIWGVQSAPMDAAAAAAAAAAPVQPAVDASAGAQVAAPGPSPEAGVSDMLAQQQRILASAASSTPLIDATAPVVEDTTAPAAPRPPANPRSRIALAGAMDALRRKGILT